MCEYISEKRGRYSCRDIILTVMRTEEHKLKWGETGGGGNFHACPPSSRRTHNLTRFANLFDSREGGVGILHKMFCPEMESKSEECKKTNKMKSLRMWQLFGYTRSEKYFKSNKMLVFHIAIGRKSLWLSSTVRGRMLQSNWPIGLNGKGTIFPPMASSLP